MVEQLQQQLASLIAQPATTTVSSAKPSTVVPPSPSTKSEAKEPRQPSSYKPPQPRTCEKCSTTFPSGQALFKHLPDCQPFKCTKCDSTFPSNTTLHKHIRGCRRLKENNPKPASWTRPTLSTSTTAARYLFSNTEPHQPHSAASRDTTTSRAMKGGFGLARLIVQRR